MRYFVVTTKHHDGFCLWDTDLTDYKVTNTPGGEDLIAPMVEAFRAEGMKVGFYHSLIDWHHPEFPVDGLHPRRDDTEYIEANTDRDIARYREYLHGQTRELLTRLRQGRHHVVRLLLLGPGLGRQGQGRLGLRRVCMEMVRELQPGIIVNDRLEIGGDLEDARAVPAARAGREVGRGAGPLGGVPDPERSLGLRPRQPGLEAY